MIENLIKSLEINKIVIASTLSGLKPEEYGWKPDENTWSIREIICHLHDEETEDFRARLEHILFHPEKPLVKIEPENWVKERAYQDQAFEWALKSFIIERDITVDELEGWVNQNWENKITHPQFGEISATKLLHNWLAHDYIHIRQINKNRYLYLKSLNEGMDLSYAGNW